MQQFSQNCAEGLHLVLFILLLSLLLFVYNVNKIVYYFATTQFSYQSVHLIHATFQSKLCIYQMWHSPLQSMLPWLPLLPLPVVTWLPLLPLVTTAASGYHANLCTVLMYTCSKNHPMVLLLIAMATRCY